MIPREFKRAIADEIRSWPYIRVTEHGKRAELAVFQDLSRTCEDGLDILLGHAKPAWSRVCIVKLRSNPRLSAQVLFFETQQKTCQLCNGEEGSEKCPDCEGQGWYDVDGVFDTHEVDLDAPDSMDRLFAIIRGNYKLLKWREATGITA